MALSAVQMTHQAALRLRRSQNSRSFRSLCQLQLQDRTPRLRVLRVLRRLRIIENVWGATQANSCIAVRRQHNVYIVYVSVLSGGRRPLVHLQNDSSTKTASLVRIPVTARTRTLRNRRHFITHGKDEQGCTYSLGTETLQQAAAWVDVPGGCAGARRLVKPSFCCLSYSSYSFLCRFSSSYFFHFGGMVFGAI